MPGDSAAEFLRQPAVVKLAILLSRGHFSDRNEPDAMSTNRNVPLRGIADSTKRESAPPAHCVIAYIPKCGTYAPPTMGTALVTNFLLRGPKEH